MTKEKDTTSAFGDNNPWSFGSKSKKKTTTSTGFNFGDFGALDDGNDIGLNEDTVPEEPNTTSDAGWGFSAVNKKDKKKKGKDEETIMETLPETEKVEDDSWSPWGASKKDKESKKSKKKGILDEEVLTVPDPPAPEQEPVDEWSAFSFGKKDKDKKKSKKVAEDSIEEKKEETIEALPDASNKFDWGFGSKKDKDKKSKKGLISEVDEDPIVAIEDNGTTEPLETGNDWLGSGWGASKKDKKKKNVVDDAFSTFGSSTAFGDSNATTTVEPVVEDTWGSFGAAKSKKDDKLKKSKKDEKSTGNP